MVDQRKVSHMTGVRRAKAKANMKRTRSPSPGPRSPRRNIKDGQGVSKGRVPKGTNPSGKDKQPP